MKQDWQELSRLTRGDEIVIEQVRLAGRGISIKGEFDRL